MVPLFLNYTVQFIKRRSNLSAEELSPRARAKRDRIVGAARRLFLERGYERTSMEAIRAEAGVSKPTLYSYYPGKEALFDAVLRGLMEGPQDWLPAASELSLESREDLRRVLSDVAERAIENFMRPDHLALARVIIAETPRFPRLGELFLSGTLERNLGFVSALLGRARERGLVEVDDADAVWRMLVGPLLTYVWEGGLFRGHGAPRRPAPERVEVVVDLCMRAIAVADGQKNEGGKG